MKPGDIIHNMPMQDYLDDPCPAPSLQSSAISTLINASPLHLWNETKRLNPQYEERERARVLDIGTAAHSMVCEGEEAFTVLDVSDFRTKAAREARDEAAASGRIVLKADEYERVKAMADAAWKYVDRNEELAGTLEGARREVSMFAIDQGVWCRARPDFWCEQGNRIVHYKTTDARLGVTALDRLIANAGWHMTAEHYRAVGALCAGTEPDQIFMVQEQRPPHSVLFLRLRPVWFGMARMRREYALRIFKACLKADKWPGLPTATIDVEAPEWLERRETDAKDANSAIDFVEALQGTGFWA